MANVFEKEKTRIIQNLNNTPCTSTSDSNASDRNYITFHFKTEEEATDQMPAVTEFCDKHKLVISYRCCRNKGFVLKYNNDIQSVSEIN